MAIIRVIRFFAAFQTRIIFSIDGKPGYLVEIDMSWIHILEYPYTDFYKVQMYRMSDYSLDVHRLYQLLCDNLVSNGHYHSVEFFF